MTINLKSLHYQAFIYTHKFFSSKKQFVHACSVVTMISRNISMNKSQNTKTENGISSVYISHYTACHHEGCSHLGIIELPSS